MAQSQLVKEFLEHRRMLFGFLLALTRDYALAEELFQDVGVAILDEAGRGVQVNDFPAWARTLARHRVADHFRTCGRRGAMQPLTDAMADAVCLAFDENPIEPSQGTVRMRVLEECLKNLPDRSRSVLDGRYAGGESMREIAGRLGWKEASVKTALGKARKALGDCMDGKLRLLGEGGAA